MVGKTVVVCNSKVINDTKVDDKVKAKLREMGQRAGPKSQGDLRFQYINIFFLVFFFLLLLIFNKCIV